VQLDSQVNRALRVIVACQELRDSPEHLVLRDQPVHWASLGAKVTEVYRELQARLASLANAVKMELPDLQAVRDRREPLDPTDRSEVQETPEQSDWPGSPDSLDSLGHRVRLGCQDSKVIQARWVTPGHLGLLEVLELLDSPVRKVPSDHLDHLECLATPERQELKLLRGSKDSLDLLDSQVNYALRSSSEQMSNLSLSLCERLPLCGLLNKFLPIVVK